MESQRYIPCAICGKMQDVIFYRKTNEYSRIWDEQHICFDCAFWEKFFSRKHDNAYVIDGDVYIINPIQSELKRVKRPTHKPDRIIHLASPNLKLFLRSWESEMRYQGTLTPRLHELHPDDLHYMDQDTWWRLYDFGLSTCPRKGCFDRYNCHLYDPSVSEPDGPWNKLPDDYEVGCEECESFVHKNKIFIKKP